VTFDEDRSQVRCESIPQVMAALRNTGISLLRVAGYPNIAKSLSSDGGATPPCSGTHWGLNGKLNGPALA
jgi:hypothetical protein